MKSAFTMIELIFVIVIIGILASVAIPKLVATRDDAKVSAITSQISIAVQDIAAYAVAKGETTTDFTFMSSAVATMINTQNAVQIDNALNIKMNTINNCLILEVLASAQDSNLTISYGNAANDNVCQSLQQTIHAEDYPIPLKGRRIEL